MNLGSCELRGSEKISSFPKNVVKCENPKRVFVNEGTHELPQNSLGRKGKKTPPLSRGRKKVAKGDRKKRGRPPKWDGGGRTKWGFIKSQKKWNLRSRRGNRLGCEKNTSEKNVKRVLPRDANPFRVDIREVMGGKAMVCD